jgi:phosphatidate phosphatase APP1
VVIGRAHRGKPVVERPGDGKARRAWATIEEVEAHPLDKARIELTVAGRPCEAVSDERGYFSVTFQAQLAPPRATVTARLVDGRFRADVARAEIAVFPPGPGLAVVSDVDDTLLDTGVAHKLRMLQRELERRSGELVDFPDAQATLRKFAAGKAVIYLSGSPWALHRRLADHFRAAGFPDGPILLKRFSREPWTEQAAYKWPHLVELTDAMPERELVLFGDSGESDPEVYARLQRERPGRVHSIYIHLVTDEEPAAPRFRGMTVFRSWAELAAKLPSSAPAAPPTSNKAAPR